MPVRTMTNDLTLCPNARATQIGFTSLLVAARLSNLILHMKRILFPAFALLGFSQLFPLAARAWDYEGHALINRLALASLPTNFPAFVKPTEAGDRVAFLAGEPDRWRNTPDLPLQHCQEPEHFMDLELLASFELKPESLPPLRYDFISALAAFRKAHPDTPIGDDSRNDPAHKYNWVGLLPWAITENYAKLKS